MGQVEWQKPPIRVGADAHIGPRVRQQGGRLIPASSACQVSGRCGHRPLREFGDFTIQLSQASTFRGPLHTRPCGATLSKQERAGVSLIRQGLRPATFPGGEGCPSAGGYRLLVMLPIGDFSRGSFHRLLHSCGKEVWGRGYPQKISTALLQAVEKFSRFPRGVRRWGRGGRRLIRVI